uniref:Uncharacterized protein n=1 Tax=Sphaerodactylus townsendi TaxID=933632 RepID=A0ACB8GET6_9SAUR
MENKDNKGLSAAAILAIFDMQPHRNFRITTPDAIHAAKRTHCTMHLHILQTSSAILRWGLNWLRELMTDPYTSVPVRYTVKGPVTPVKDSRPSPLLRNTGTATQVPWYRHG